MSYNPEKTQPPVRFLYNGNNIHAFHFYLPKRRWPDPTYADLIAESRRILDFKDKNPTAIRYYEKFIFSVILNLLQRLPAKRLIAIPIPPSKANTIPAMYDLLNILENDLRNASLYQTSFINGTGALIRTHSIATSHHAEKRPGIADHLKTISCRNRFNDNDFIVLIDDVVTSGSIMKACTKILSDHGAAPENIFKIALAKTLSSA